MIRLKPIDKIRMFKKGERRENAMIQVYLWYKVIWGFQEGTEFDPIEETADHFAENEASLPSTLNEVRRVVSNWRRQHDEDYMRRLDPNEPYEWIE